MIITGSKSKGSSGDKGGNRGTEIASVAYMKLLLALSEGEIAGGFTGKEIYLDGTPLLDANGSENFPGVSWEWRSGTPDQSYIQGFPAVENEIAVGRELKYGTPWVKSVNNTQLSAVRLRFKFPQGIYATRDSGGKNAYRLDFAIDISTDGSTYTEYGTDFADGIANTGYERSYRVDLPHATSGWQIRVRRLTENTTDGRHADVSNIESMTEIVDAKLKYPNTALLFLQFDSKLFDGKTPVVTVKTKGLVIRVPSNYDPISRTYAGTWDGTFKWAWTNNPAWVFYDIVLNKRYGLGKRISADQVDKWTLYQIARRCDEQVSDGTGGKEARFICDLYLSQRTDAWTVLMDLANIFQGMLGWSNNLLTLDADMPRQLDPDFVFNKSNIIGPFTFSGSSEKANYSAGVVTYSNPANGYQDDQASAFVPELTNRFGFNTLEMSAIGCTRESEAQRRLLWAIHTNSDDNAVEFKTGREGRIPRVGKVIGINNGRQAGRANGGRVAAAAGTKITLDRTTTAKAGDRLIINLPSGSAEGRTVKSVSGRAVTVESAYSETPSTEAGWVLDQQDLAIQQFRVKRVAINDDGTVTISGLPFNPNKFPRIDSGAIIEDRPVTVVPPRGQPMPENIVISSTYRVEQGIGITTMEVTWNRVTGAVAYEAQWRQNNGEWINVTRTGNTRFEVDGIYAGTYTVRVRAINGSDIASLWAISAETQLTGKTGAVPAPVGLKTAPLIFGVDISWGFRAGASDTMKTELQYSAAFDGSNPVLLSDVAYPQSNYQQLGLKFGVTFWYRARLIDRLGNKSAWTGWVSGMPNDSVADYFENLDEALEKSDTKKELDKSIQDNIDAIQKEVADRSAAITKEATDRAKAISQETSARTQALTKEAGDRTAAIAAEATIRSQQDQKVAADAANGLLNEKLTREAAISETNLIIQNKTDSLAQSIAQVAAGSGTQFDSLKIWHFNSASVEGWTGNGTPTVVDNSLRPANHANNPYVVSPASLAVDAASYRFVKLRIKKVGKPAWRGQLRWRDTAAFNDTNMVTLAEPAFDASGVATIDFSDIKWNTLANVAQIRLDIGATQTASDYFLIDWIAVGRPAPGASTAALEDESTARISADAAEATARNTLAAQLRGGNDGTDPSKLTSGLIYNERQVRVSAEKAISEDVKALETNFNANKTAVQQSLKTLTDSQTSQGQVITNISASLKYANIDAANMLTNGSFESDLDYWDDRANRQVQSIVNGGAYNGDKVLRFSAYPNGTSSVIQRGIILLKGRTYRISAMCKFSADAVDAGTGNTKLALRNNASDALIAAAAFGANENPLPTAWVERGFDYKVGTSDLVVKISVGSYISAGTMDIDFVRVMDITDAKAIETKADAGALSTLDGKVKAVGDTVDAQGTALTQVKASIGRRTVFSAVSVGSGGTGGITAAGIFREDGSKAATPARSYMLTVFSTNADGSTTLTRTNYDLYGNGVAASTAFNDAVAALANGTYVAVTTYDEPNGSKSRIYDAIESLGGSREAMNQMVSRSAYILLGCKGIGRGNGQELVSPVGGSADARVTAAIEFVNGVMIGLGAGASAIANANASATNALDAKVTQNGKDISAQADAITQLKTDVGGKVNQLAFNQLGQRVTETEESIESQQKSINGLTTSLGKKADSSVVTELSNSVNGRIDTIDLKTTRIDLTALDQNMYYPVTMQIPSNGISKGPTRIRVARPLDKSYGIKQSDGTYKNPDWATHANGFNASMEWTAIGSGWGANDTERNVYEYQYRPNWIVDGVAPVVNVGQMLNSSTEYIYLRGGSQYDVSTPFSVTPVLRTGAYTLSSQTINLISVGGASVVVPSTIRQDTAANATATTALKSTLKDAAADTENMIANGGAESGLELWEGSPQPAVVSTAPYLGSKCFEYSGTLSMLMYQRGLTMLKDRTYRISMMAKFSTDASVDASNGWGNTKASIRNDANNAFIAEVQFKGSSATPVTSWTEFTFEYKPAGDIITRLAVSSLLKSGKMWIDNIRIEDVTDAKANETTATAVNELQTTVKNQGDTLSAQAQSIQSLNTNLGKKAEASSLTQTDAKVTQQGKDITANTKSVSDLKTRVEGAESGLNQTFESIAQQSYAQFRGYYEQRAQIVKNDTAISASVIQVNQTITSEAGALAGQLTDISAQVNKQGSDLASQSAAVQVNAQAIAQVDGKVSAQWSVKVDTDSNGHRVAAGVQLGSDGETSAFLVNADTFGVYTPAAAGGKILAFAVSGATAYLRSAMIQDLSLDFGKISDTLQSTNFVDGQVGWRLGKGGNMQINGGTAGQRRFTLDNNRIVSYDAQGRPTAVFGAPL